MKTPQRPGATVLATMLMTIVLVAPASAQEASSTKDIRSVEGLALMKELPDPFIFQDGRRVQSPTDWPARRKEVAELVQAYQYGHLPPSVPVKEIKATELATRTVPDTGATEKRLILTIGNAGKIRTYVDLTIPPGKGPFPVIVRGDLGWHKLKDPILAEAAKRGYAVAEFDRTLFAADKKDVRDGIYLQYPDTDAGALAAWAWGFHRVTDYLLTLPEIDKERVIVTGHSRGGKAALLAGALDERVALTVPNNSGCGGAGCYRLQAAKSEDIAAITKNFPYWFHPRFTQFIGKIDRLPIDQHSVKALVAPRALLSTEALDDLWANPMGSQQSHAAAKEVFDYLGAGDKIAIYFRPGKHEHNAGDWTVLMDYADKVLRGKTVERQFNNYAFPDAEKGYSWAAPKTAAN